MRVDDLAEVRSQTWIVTVDAALGDGLALHARSRSLGIDPRRPGLGGWTPSPYHLLDVDRSRVRTGRGRLRGRVRVTTGGRGAAVPSNGQELLVSAGAGALWFVFDATGRHLRTVEPRHAAVVWRFEHDRDRLVRVLDRDDVPVLSAAPADGAVDLHGAGPLRVRVHVDERGWADRFEASDGTTTTCAFDDGGRLVELVDAAGRRREASYDGHGRLSALRRPAGPSFDLVRHVDGARTTITKLDAAGREARYVTESLPDGTVRRTTWCCGGTQPSVRERRGDESVLTKPDGTVVRRSVSRTPVAHHSRWELTTPGGLHTVQEVGRRLDPGSGRSDTTTTVNGRAYVGSRSRDGTTTLTDPDGRRTVVVVDEAGRPRRIVGPATDVTYTWDEAGRITRVEVDGTTTNAGYDRFGRLDRLESDGTGTWFDHDDHGRVVAQRWADGRQVTIGYGPAGDVVSVEPPGRPATRFEHLDRGVLGSVTLPAVSGATATQAFSYDAAGSLVGIHRADGRTVELERGPQGWLRAIRGDDAGVEVERDPRTGALTGSSTVDGATEQFTWDGSLLVRSVVDGPAPGTVSCRWDEDRRPASLVVDGAEPVEHRWDASGRLLGLGRLALGRDPATGEVVERRLGTVVERRTYERGRLRHRSVLVDDAELIGEERTHDGQGQLVGVVTQVMGVVTTESYEHDRSGRLVAHRRDDVTTRWDYDLNGNRVTARTPDGEEHFAYDERDRLTQWGTRTVAHSADGELTGWADGSGATRVVHDSLGRLRHVHLPDGRAVTHRYDAQGRRVATEVDGKVIGRWLWWGFGGPVAEVDAEGRVVRAFVGSARPAARSYVVDGDRTLLVVRDAQGSPRWWIDGATGAIMLDLRRDPWGALVDGSVPPAGPYGFLGGMVDGITPFVRLGARDLVADIGRWTTPDPLGYRGGDTNWFAYARSNPIERADPTGLKTELCRRPARGLGLEQVGAHHVWFKTKSAEAGMGSHPFKTTAVPFSDETAVRDHTGDSDDPEAECEEVPDADEECVTAALQTPLDVGDLDPSGRGIKYGRDTGLWGPTNNCQTFAEEVLRGCGSAYSEDRFDEEWTRPSETAAYDGGESSVPDDGGYTPAPDHTPAPDSSSEDDGSSSSDDGGYTPAPDHTPAPDSSSEDGPLWD